VLSSSCVGRPAEGICSRLQTAPLPPDPWPDPAPVDSCEGWPDAARRYARRTADGQSGERYLPTLSRTAGHNALYLRYTMPYHEIIVCNLLVLDWVRRHHFSVFIPASESPYCCAHTLPSM
jgi:hypothetical protein